jgi:GTPase SAR1 family protein
MSVEELKNTTRTLLFSAKQLFQFAKTHDRESLSRVSFQCAHDTKQLLLLVKQIRSSVPADQRDHWTGVQQETHRLKTCIVDLISEARDFCTGEETDLAGATLQLKATELYQGLKRLLGVLEKSRPTSAAASPPVPTTAPSASASASATGSHLLKSPPALTPPSPSRNSPSSEANAQARTAAAQRVREIIEKLQALSPNQSSAKDRLKEYSTELVTQSRIFDSTDAFKDKIRKAMQLLIDYYKSTSSQKLKEANSALDEILKHINDYLAPGASGPAAPLAPAPSSSTPASTDAPSKSSSKRYVDPRDRLKSARRRNSVASITEIGPPRSREHNEPQTDAGELVRTTSGKQESTVCVVGEVGAGKRSLITRLTENKFVQNKTTAPGDLLGKKHPKRINAKSIFSDVPSETADEQQHDMLLFRFGPRVHSFRFANAMHDDMKGSLKKYHSSHMCLLVFSLANRETFEWVIKFHQFALDGAERSSCVPILVGTHSDEAPQVNPLDVHNFAVSNNYAYVLLSCKTGESSDDLKALMCVSRPGRDRLWPLAYNPKPIQEEFTSVRSA